MIELDPLWIKYRLHYSEASAAGNNSSWLNNSIATANADEFLLSHQLERNPLGLKNDNVVSGQRPLVRIQPYQGSNPCMERNIQQLAKDNDEGNVYVTGSAKDKIKPCPQQQPILVQQPRRQNFEHSRNPPIQYIYNNIGRTSNVKNINANSKAHC